MKLGHYRDYLKDRTELVPTVMLAVSALSAVLILVKVTTFYVGAARAENAVRRAMEQSKTDPKNIQKELARLKPVAANLKKDNLFSPPPPREHPVKEVWGILGDEVLIKDKWYKVGQMVADAKIVAVEPTEVSIEWDGKVKVFLPIDAAEAPAPKGSRPSQPGARPSSGSPGERADMVVVQSQPGSRGPGGPGPGGRFEGMRERFQNMSEADRDRFRREMEQRREQFMRMSPDQRERFVRDMRERFSRGRDQGRGR